MEKLKRGIGGIAVVIGTAVLVLVAIVGLFVQKRSSRQEKQQVEALPTVSQTTIQKTSPTPTTIQIKPADATDAKLDKDFSDIDASINAINTEGTAIDVGLNDQMGDLSE